MYFLSTGTLQVHPATVCNGLNRPMDIHSPTYLNNERQFFPEK